MGTKIKAWVVEAKGRNANFNELDMWVISVLPLVALVLGIILGKME
jgi:hypothetical protein